MLFDQFERSYSDASDYSEPKFSYLNRANRPEYAYVRDLVQSWFDEYDTSEEKKKHLLQAFRSQEDRKHLSAFFELYLLKLFKSFGFGIEIEPEWAEKKPDFLLTSPTGEQILLEATACYPEQWFGNAQKREYLTLDEINKRVNSPNFFLHINVKNAPTSVPPYKKLCNDIMQEISKLNADGVIEIAEETDPFMQKENPRLMWEHESWNIEIEFIPKRPLARNRPDIKPIGSMIKHFDQTNIVNNIRLSINNKYGRYGELSIPYILAINIADGFVHNNNIFDALFGDEVIYVVEPGKTKVGREQNGSWRDVKGFQKQRMSGILVFRSLLPVIMHRVEPELWHHPYANNPLKPEILPFAQHVPNTLNEHYEFREGSPLTAIMGIDPEKMPK